MNRIKHNGLAVSMICIFSIVVSCTRSPQQHEGAISDTDSITDISATVVTDTVTIQQTMSREDTVASTNVDTVAAPKPGPKTLRYAQVDCANREEEWVYLDKLGFKKTFMRDTLEKFIKNLPTRKRPVRLEIYISSPNELLLLETPHKRHGSHSAIGYVMLNGMVVDLYYLGNASPSSLSKYFRVLEYNSKRVGFYGFVGPLDGSNGYTFRIEGDALILDDIDDEWLE